jgi:hypothetical protein
MQSSRLTLLALKALLAALFVFLLVMQLLSLPGQFIHSAQESPGTASVSWALLAACEVVALCLQVVVVCTWRLSTMVARDRIFSAGSLPWVDELAGACIAGWAALAAASAYVAGFIYLTPELRDPGVPILLFGLTLAGAVIPLLVTVLRALLRQAADLRAEIDVVI